VKRGAEVVVLDRALSLEVEIHAVEVTLDLAGALFPDFQILFAECVE